jgi:hypothetical protein
MAGSAEQWIAAASRRHAADFEEATRARPVSADNRVVFERVPLSALCASEAPARAASRNSGGVPLVAANYCAGRTDQLATIRPEGDTFQRVVS